MTSEPGFDHLIAAAGGRRGLLRLLGRLGFQGAAEPIPRSAWVAWGIGGSDVAAAWLAGRAGTLEALLLELREDPAPDRLARVASGVRARNAARLHLFVFAGPGYDALALGTFGVDGSFRHVAIERAGIRATDVEALEEMAARPGETGLELALRQARALDRGRVTRRFFREFRAHRSAIADAWLGVPRDARRERSQLALLFLCRLTFLYFIQKRGTLAGDEQYLTRLLGEWVASTDPAPSDGTTRVGGATSFYRARLDPLFFAALNRHPADRDAAGRALGALPYLNGGLFERTALERRYSALDLPDAAVGAAITGLLERYRFTTREAGDGAGLGVDPEMLGRVFEGLMAPDRRGDTGSFYTPAPVVARVVREAVSQYLGTSCGQAAAAVLDGYGTTLDASTRRRAAHALEHVRVLDPACGSGAFLLGALWRLSIALGAATGRPPGAVRRDIVARSLHGVDLLDDAALLCSLRLWLALSADEGEIRPLPNLDRRIRQGDALVDPLDLGTGPDAVPAEGFHPLRDPGIRRALGAVEPAARAYLESEPGDRAARRAELAEAERGLARRWTDGVRRAEARRLRQLGAIARDRDLFGDPSDAARRAARELPQAKARLAAITRLARQVEERGAVPFFSFGIHFAEAAAGFDIILSNPPWVRAHRWPEHLRRLGGHAFEVCRRAGWRAGARLSGAPAGAGAQVDLALLFLERAVRLLVPGGVLAMLLPAKSLRALYGSGARAILLRDLEISSIEDHALDHRSIFRADAFTGVVIGRRRRSTAPGEESSSSRVAGAAEERGATVRVRMMRRAAAPLEFRVRQEDLPLFPDDPESPWLLAPPAVAEGLRRMQRTGPPLGAVAGMRVRRGIMTGANDALLLAAVTPGLGGLSRIEAEGFGSLRRSGRSAGAAARYRAHVETAAIRPLVRGADIDAFSYRTGSYVVWCHDGTGRPADPPPRLARYLARHRTRLEARSGWRPGLPLGVVFRLSAETLGHKVAWHDLSDTVRAVALPPRVRLDGADRELVPLNTVYFLPAPDRDAALLLAGLLNSLPVRVFARAIAERAKDARFRFFAWTMSCLPLPPDWRRHPAARELLRISTEAHAGGGIAAAAAERLDRAAARLFGLGHGTLAEMARFDRWLRGAR